MRFSKSFNLGLVICGLLCCAWGSSRVLLETSYPIPPDMRANHIIRVKVGSAKTSFQVSTSGAFRVEGSQSEILISGAMLPSTPIKILGSGIQFGHHVFKTQAIFIRSLNDAGIRYDKRTYKNGLEVKRKGVSELLIINHIDLEHYLKGVIPFEANPKWSDATLQASAIVSRTFALFKMIEKRNQDFDVGSGALSQVYAGENVRHDRTDRIVDQTRGRIMLFQGQIFPAYFHSTSGGATTSADSVWSVKPHPALQGVVCEFCRSSKHDVWTGFVKYADIEKAVRDEGGVPVRGVKEVKLKNFDRSGRAREIEMIGKNGKFTVAFSELRGWVGAQKIKSTLVPRYLNDANKKGVTFFGRGWGHGVGLDQYGAKLMGELGYSPMQILDYFYPEIVVEKIYD